MPRLVEAQTEYGPEGLAVVAITDADEARVREFVQEHGITYPVLADAGELKDQLGVNLVWGSVIYLVDARDQMLVEGLDDSLERLATEVGAG